MLGRSLIAISSCCAAISIRFSSKSAAASILETGVALTRIAVAMSATLPLNQPLRGNRFGFYFIIRFWFDDVQDLIGFRFTLWFRFIETVCRRCPLPSASPTQSYPVDIVLNRAGMRTRSTFVNDVVSTRPVKTLGSRSIPKCASACISPERFGVSPSIFTSITIGFRPVSVTIASGFFVALRNGLVICSLMLHDSRMCRSMFTNTVVIVFSLFAIISQICTCLTF